MTLNRWTWGHGCRFPATDACWAWTRNRNRAIASCRGPCAGHHAGRRRTRHRAGPGRRRECGAEDADLLGIRDCRSAGRGATSINCPQVLQSRAQHDAQNIAILNAHMQREKRLQAEIRNELTKAMTRQLAASEAKLQGQFDASLAQVRQDVATTLRRVNLMTGILAGVVVLIILGAVGVVWRSGMW